MLAHKIYKEIAISKRIAGEIWKYKIRIKGTLKGILKGKPEETPEKFPEKFGKELTDDFQSGIPIKFAKGLNG